MEDVGGRTTVRYFHQKPITLFLKRPREDNRISWGYAVWPWLSENSNSPLIHFLTEQILTAYLWCAGNVSWHTRVSFLSWASSAVCLCSLSPLSFFVDYTTIVTTFSLLNSVSDLIIFLFKMWMAYLCLQVKTNSLARNAWSLMIVHMGFHLSLQSHLGFSSSMHSAFLPNGTAGYNPTSCGFSDPCLGLLSYQEFTHSYPDSSAKILFVLQGPVQYYFLCEVFPDPVWQSKLFTPLCAYNILLNY